MTEGIVNFEDWMKLDLRVGEVLEVEEIEGADKLYKLTVNVGDEIGKRTICSGIKKYFSKEDLKGRKIIVFVNLAPRKMRGVESQGMLLATEDEGAETISLLSVDKSVLNGSRVS